MIDTLEAYHEKVLTKDIPDMLIANLLNHDRNHREVLEP
jgi:hypothetical protein